MEKIQNINQGELSFFLNQNIQIDIPGFVLSLIFAAILSFFCSVILHQIFVNIIK